VDFGATLCGMPVIPTPVAGERESLLEYLRYHHSAFLAVADGLSDEQARSTPTVSTLSIGGLIKHVTVVEYAWTQQVAVAPELLSNDPWSLVGMMSHREEQHVMREDENLAELLAAFEAQKAATLRVFSETDLNATIIVPEHVQQVCEDAHWTARWALLNINEELARHAGHADIIRESIDGATMFPPNQR
jgi:uncharacterized damage-inducible protein DinB